MADAKSTKPEVSGLCFLFSSSLVGDVIVLQDRPLPIPKHAPGPFEKAAKDGDVKKLDELLKAGAELNERLTGGLTVLMTAAYYSRKEAVEFLLSQKAEVNVRSPRAMFALGNAAYWGDKDVVTLLLKAGADKTLTNKEGQTPAQCAAARGFKDLAAFIDSWKG